MLKPTLLLGLLSLILLPQTSYSAGMIVAAGGGTEGDLGDVTSWSYKLYRKLIQNGDRNGDGAITVAILSTAKESEWLPQYFVWLGATSAFNVKVSTRADADNPGIVDPVAGADVVFIKGGDQGVYYDQWNNTRLEAHIRTVVETLNGAIGGTSAGAMSQSQYCLAGGQDLVSLDVLTDAQTRYLDDTDGGSSIHTDFLGFVPGVVIDTHYTQRARLGRLAGVLGKALEDNGLSSLLGIGIDEQTGIAIQGDVAEVIGIGAVDFLQPTSSSVLQRTARHPLLFTELRQDRLTEGWRYNLRDRLPDTVNRPLGTSNVVYAGNSGANSSALTLKGDDPREEEKFAWVVNYSPFAYSIRKGTASPYIKDSFGIVDAQDSDLRGAVHESAFRALYDLTDYSGFLVADSGQVTRQSFRADFVKFERNTSLSYPEAASIVISGKSITHKGLSPYVSSLDTGSGTLRAAAFVNARIHILGESGYTQVRYSTRAQEVSFSRF